MTEQIQNNEQQNEDIQALSELSSRMKLASQLGMQYGGKRDLYEALGWKKQLQDYDYWQAYLRQDIASAINDAPVNATWREGIMVTDNSKSGQFDNAWNDLVDRLRLYNKFSRADKLAGLGYYAVLVLGFDDVANEREFQQPVNEDRQNRLLYVHPYSQKNAQVHEWETDPTQERYGLPKVYKVKIGVPGTVQDETKQGRDLYIHHSRVIHVAEGLLESEVYGTPRLQSVFNRFEDLAKIVGGSGEMFWRGAFPGYAAKARDNATMNQQDKDDLDKQFEEYEHQLRRWLKVSGLDIDELSSQVADPSSHVDVQMTMISAATGIPKRILMGSERGELSSNQDETNWNKTIDDRRSDYAEAVVLRPFIDTMIKYGVLPQPEQNNYDIQWPDLWAPGLKDKSEIAKNYSGAIKEYSSAPAASAVIPERFFLTNILQLPEEDVDEIMREAEQGMTEEERQIEEDQQTIEEEGQSGVTGGEEE